MSTSDGDDDFVLIDSPSERLRLAVVLVENAFERCLKIGKGSGTHRAWVRGLISLTRRLLKWSLELECK